MMLGNTTSSFKSLESKVFAVCTSPLAFDCHVIAAVRILMLSLRVTAPVMASSSLLSSFMKSLAESTFFPLMASKRSPFLIPILYAGPFSIMLSTSALRNGRQNIGDDFNMLSRLMSPGRLMLIGLPLRMISTRFAFDRSRKRSALKSLNVPLSVPTRMSRSLKP